ncbi:unnamed protein product [Calicophoron daubneyi]|uniref:RNA exonuclease 4 n=1 Tax=Calicophoron daubneyi TaxID=300641 RepID=A0AAV2TZD6_CALDB
MQSFLLPMVSASRKPHECVSHAVAAGFNCNSRFVAVRTTDLYLYELVMRCYPKNFPRRRHTSPFPIKCDPCVHIANVTTGLSNSQQPDEEIQSELQPIALDCEMVGVGPKMTSALGRISIVDYFGNLLYDVMVRPRETITDYRTRWSGIRVSDMHRSIPFECVQDQVERIIRNRIVVGHMVRNDFQVLGLKHPEHLIRDTAVTPYARLLAGFQGKHVIALQALTIRLFGIRIQNGEHCSTEDARATMAIYRLVEKVWEAELLKRKTPLPITSGKVHATESNEPRLGDCDTDTNDSIPLSQPGQKRANDDPLNTNVCTKCSSVSPSPVHCGLAKSSSTASLLDDNFWPDESDRSSI